MRELTDIRLTKDKNTWFASGELDRETNGKTQTWWISASSPFPDGAVQKLMELSRNPARWDDVGNLIKIR